RTIISTIDIFRKPVVSTAKKGNRARAAETTAMPGTLISPLPMTSQPDDPDADAVADPHHHAAADAPAVAENVDLAGNRGRERQNAPRRQPLHLGERQIEPPELEDEVDRHHGELRILRVGSGSLLLP